MKQCPRCGKTYDDDQLNFCLEDGELLSTTVQQRGFPDDSPPTLVINDVRTTNPYTQQAAPGPIGQWQPASPYKQFSPMNMVRGADQTMPTVSLVLGLISLPMICCYGGLYLGIPAAIIGFIGLRNADSDSQRYGGRGMAIAGMVLGVISFLSTIGFVIFAILAS